MANALRSELPALLTNTEARCRKCPSEFKVPMTNLLLDCACIVVKLKKAIEVIYHLILKYFHIVILVSILYITLVF